MRALCRRDMWLRKAEKGYKLISAAGVQKAILSNDIRDEDLDIFFYVDYIKGTKDTYFTGTCETMGKLTLEDNAGTHFTVRLMDSSFLGTDQKDIIVMDVYKICRMIIRLL